jgi:hypothetical protein
MAADKLLTLSACIHVLPSCQAQNVLAEPKPCKHAGDFPLFVLKYLRKRHGMMSMVQQVSSVTHCYTALCTVWAHTMGYTPLSEKASVVCHALTSASPALLALIRELP